MLTFSTELEDIKNWNLFLRLVPSEPMLILKQSVSLLFYSARWWCSIIVNTIHDVLCFFLCCLVFDGDIFHLSTSHFGRSRGGHETIIINKFDVHSMVVVWIHHKMRTTKKGVLCLHRDRVIEQCALSQDGRKGTNYFFILQVKREFFLLFNDAVRASSVGCLPERRGLTAPHRAWWTAKPKK